MKIKIPYGKKFQSLSISEDRIISIIRPREVTINNERESILQSLHHPLGCKPFPQFIDKINKVLFIINDATRSTPTEKVLEAMEGFINNKDVFFLIATGTHRAPFKKELRKLLGKYYNRYVNRIFVHDAKDSDIVKAGVTERGTEVYYNKIIYNFKGIISISSVEPHYFAGFTGGRKSFLPGIAAFRTTEMNHKLALAPGSDVLKLKGNPVHEDMNQALKLLDTKKIFSIQTVLNRDNSIYFTAAGDIELSFQAAVKKSLEIYSIPLREKANIVIAVVTPPLDINLYQSHKALQHAKLALKPDGIIILVSPCSEGMGNRIFSELLRFSETKDKLLKYAEKNFVLGTQTAVKFTRLSKQAQLWAVTDIETQIIESIFMKPFTTVQQAVDNALINKPEGRILILKNAALTVPVF
ncbi:MAG: nickel-dependent lactate racemase [bacterium]